MAPKRRPRKIGKTRSDAALDAMRQLGFESKLVRKTLKKLLSAYGGDDGWPFIEDSSYIVLINALLENDKDCSNEDTQAVKDSEAAGPSCPAIEPFDVSNSNAGWIDVANDAELRSHENGAREPQNGDTGSPHKNVSPTVGDQRPVSASEKRRPYHGWICDDEDHDPNDLIDLNPEPLSESLKKLLRVHKERISKWDLKCQEL